MAKRSSSPAGGPVPERSSPIAGVRVGQLVEVDAVGRPLVEFEGAPQQPFPATSFLPLSPEALRAAASERQQALLMFEDGDPARPILVALRQVPSPTPLLDAMLKSSTETEQPAPAPARPQPRVHVDGQSVVIEAEREIVLRCGESSVTLRCNGEIQLRGVKVESRASGRNLIRGGKIELN